MSADFSPLPDDAITLEQHRRMRLTRPLTDDPIGGSAGHRIRRQQSAQASKAVTPAPDPWEREHRNPETAMQDANAAIALREARRRARRKATTHPHSALTAAIGAAMDLTHPQTNHGHTGDDAA